MKKRFFFYLFLLIAATSQSQYLSHNIAFSAGEKVTYHAFYNWNFVWINAGDVTFSVDKTVYNKVPCYKFTSIGTTYKNYDTFYKVRDTFITIADTSKLLPYLYHRKNNEAGDKTYETYKFDYTGKQIYSWVLSEDKPSPGVNTVIPMKEGTVDLLTMVYRARNIDFTRYLKGDKIPIRMLVDGTIYDLYIRFLGRETITTRDKRTFRCLKFSPLLMEGTIFEGGEDMTVWVTDDKNRIPIIVEAKILIGSVKAVFVSAQGLRNPIEAEVFTTK
jgi:hypothetical protein